MNAASPQLPLPLAGNPQATLEQYVGPATLIEQLRAVAAGQLADNLWISGAQGLGKTHLQLAVCSAASAAGRRAGYVAAADLLAAGSDCLTTLDGLDLVAIDDMHLLLTQPWQEAWFHRINRWRDQSCQFVFGALTPVHGLTLTLPDLHSRLKALTELRLPRPGPEQQREILGRGAQARGLQLGEEVLDYLLRRQQRGAKALLEMLDDLDRLSLAAQRRVTLPFVRDYLNRRDGAE